MEHDHPASNAAEDPHSPSAVLSPTLTAVPSLTALQTTLSSPSPTSSSEADLVSPLGRHHIRTSKVVEASNISPRGLTWKCTGEGGGGLQLAEEVGGRSWDDEKAPDEAVPCPASAEIRKVDAETVRVERTNGSPPHSPDESLVRRGSLHNDPDSPD